MLNRPSKIFRANLTALIVLGWLAPAALAQTAQPAEPPAATQPPAAVETPAVPAQPAQVQAAPQPVDAADPAEPAPVAAPVPATSEVGALPAGKNANLPHDLSPWGMFMAADIVVKAVMIGLAFASLVTWTVGLAKSLEIAGAKMRLRKALRIILGARSLDDAAEKLGASGSVAGQFVRAAIEEMHLSTEALDHAEPSGVKERVASRLIRMQTQAGRRLNRGTGVLATIGSTAPFVGLFGTVWGIMNSFIGISQAQTTNLAVVAPGIAEALLATAIGLVAAIPAVVVYNFFARSIMGYKQGLADAGAGVERLVSRDLDHRRIPQPGQSGKGAGGPMLAAAAE